MPREALSGYLARSCEGGLRPPYAANVATVIAVGEITRQAIGPVLGAELRAARGRAGLGVRETARRLRISHSYLVLLERGERAPSAWTARRLIAVLALENPTADLIQGFGRRVEAGVKERHRARRAKPLKRRTRYGSRGPHPERSTPWGPSK